MEDSVKFFEDVIINDDLGYNNIEHLFGLRVDCGSIIKEDREQELLNRIDDILATNQHKDLNNIIDIVNYMLDMSLYYDRRNKYERILFSSDDYRIPATKCNMIVVFTSIVTCKNLNNFIQIVYIYDLYNV